VVQLARALSALLVAALIAVAVYALRPNPELAAAPVEEPQPVVVAAPPPAPAPPPEPAPAQEPLPSPPPTVKVQVQSVPPGAEVRIDQRAMGRTPLEVELDRDTRPHKLSVKRPGGDTIEQQLVPDHDQTVTLQLARRKNLRGPKH
jgi:hypothetical protein